MNKKSEPTTAAEITRLVWKVLQINEEGRVARTSPRGLSGLNQEEFEERVQIALDFLTGEFPTMQKKR